MVQDLPGFSIFCGVGYNTALFTFGVLMVSVVGLALGFSVCGCVWGVLECVFGSWLVGLIGFAFR